MQLEIGETSVALDPTLLLLGGGAVVLLVLILLFSTLRRAS